MVIGSRMTARLGAGIGALVLLGGALTACNSSKSGAPGDGQQGSRSAGATRSAICTGDPIKFGTISTLTGDSIAPGDATVSNGASAAAAALTRNCELGRPVQAVNCDDKDSPNQASACARKLVSEKVIAYMGAGLGGSTWFPILSAAGIPEIGGNGLSSIETTSKLWFPLTGNVHDAAAYGTVAKSALKEQVRAAVLPLDNPGVAFFIDFYKNQTAALDGKWVGSFPVPAATVDMSQFAAQVKNAGANAVYPILAGDQFLGLVQQLVAQGDPLTETVLIDLGSAASCTFLKQVGPAGEGLWLIDTAWPVGWDTSSTGAQQYIKELADAGLPHDSCDVSEFGVQAWSAMHIMADLMKGTIQIDSATLIEKLNASGPITRSELASTVDWSKNAFPNDPVLSKLRVFSKQFLVSRIVNGKPQLVTTTPPTVGSTFTVK